MSATPDVLVDTVGDFVAIETISHGAQTGHSVLITPRRAVALIDQLAEQEPVARLLQERAREAASHAERGLR